jgi:hypothetical protein
MAPDLSASSETAKSVKLNSTMQANPTVRKRRFHTGAITLFAPTKRDLFYRR